VMPVPPAVVVVVADAPVVALVGPAVALPCPGPNSAGVAAAVDVLALLAPGPKLVSAPGPKLVSAAAELPGVMPIIRSVIRHMARRVTVKRAMSAG